MNRLAFAILAATGFSCMTALADPISPTGTAETDTTNIQTAINAAPGGTVTLASGTFALNKAITISNGASLIGAGGAPGDVVLELVSGSQANAIKIENSGSTIVSNLTVTARSDPHSGINMNSGLLVDCLITGIKTKNGQSHGGGIKMSGGTVRGCTITRCEAYNTGGNEGAGEAIYMTGGLVENCVIASNNVSYACNPNNKAGGTVYISGGTLRGCLIVDNVGHRNASGVSANGGTVENCTIAGNRQFNVESDAYGVWVTSDTVVLRNNIIWNNTDFDGDNVNVRLANAITCTFVHNDTKPLLFGTDDNISVDPLFIDAENGNYHTKYSYCSDNGIYQDWMNGAVDLDGNARIISTAVDMGCYEREGASASDCRMRVTSNGANDEARVTLEADAFGWTVTTAEWAFKRQQDGEERSVSGERLSSIDLPKGVWDVELKVHGDGGKYAETVNRAAIDVLASVVYANIGGSDSFPYDTKETGSPSINKAFRLVGNGGTLYIARGSYTIDKRIKVGDGNGSRIESIDGPENTIVRMDDVRETFGSTGMCYALYLVSGDAYVSGVTFIGGRPGTDYSGNEYFTRGFAVVSDAEAVLTNCVFRDLECHRSALNGTGLYLTAGTVSDCLFSRIDSYASGGANLQGGVIYISGGLADRIRVEDCWELTQYNPSQWDGGDVIGVFSKGILRDSLVTRCLSVRGTPAYVGKLNGVAGGYVENCTFVANTNSQMDTSKEWRYAAGLVVNGGSVTNCIVVDNWSARGNAVSNIYNSAGAAGIGYTLVNDRAGDSAFVTAENHNIAVAAGARIFRRPERGDYSPATGSPAINAGLLEDWMEMALDLAGKPRVVSRKPDLGCIESYPMSFSIRLR